MELTLAAVLDALRRIRGLADATPMVPSAYLGRRIGHEVLLKLETVQPGGSFKLRGATNAIAALPPGVPGVVCCSTGNHGRAVALAARARGLRAVVCLSDLVPEAKVAAIRDAGAELRIAGGSQDAAAQVARRLARDEGLAEIPPFDNPAIIAGQGTIALEMLAARPDLRTLIVPLSGGGLAAGVALAAKAVQPGLRVIGVSMDRGAAMHLSLQAGRPVEVHEVPSLADSLGGGIGAGNRHSFALCQRLLDETHVLTEAEIARGMQALFWEDGQVAEGAGAVGAALLLSRQAAAIRGPVGLILSGRNTDMSAFVRVVTGQDVRLGDHVVRGQAWDATY